MQAFHVLVHVSEKRNNIVAPCRGLLWVFQTDDFILDEHFDWCKVVACELKVSGILEDMEISSLAPDLSSIF